MSDYSESCVKGKAAQRGIIEQKELRHRSKKPGVFHVEYRELRTDEGGLQQKTSWKKWYRAGYPTKAAVENAVSGLSKNRPYYEFRIAA